MEVCFTCAVPGVPTTSLSHLIPVKFGDLHSQRKPPPPGWGRQVPPLEQLLAEQLLISSSQWRPPNPVPAQLQMYPVPPEGSSVHGAPWRHGSSEHVEYAVRQVGPVKPGLQRQVWPLTPSPPPARHTPSLWQ